MKLYIIEILSIILPTLLSIAYLTLAERKIMGSMQRRVGPNHIGLFGLLQPLSDGIKLLLKETILVSYSNKILFLLAPLIIFTVNLLGWATIPFGAGNNISDMELGIIYLLAMSSISVIGIILSGWASNSKYSLLGSLRTTAQLISYELVIGLTILTIVCIVSSFNINEIILFQKYTIFLFPLLPLFPILFISALAETNRVPFDLVESESELVSGAFTEYSSFSFALIFLGEYGAMISMCTLINIIFLGGYLVPFSYLFSDSLLIILEPLSLGLKTCLLLFIFIWVRATLPRIRFNQLINLNWKFLLPITLGLFMIVISLSILILPVDNTNLIYLSLLPFNKKKTEKIEETPSIMDKMEKPLLTVEHKIENSTLISEGFKAVGKGIEKLAPAAGAGIVGLSVAKAMKAAGGTPNQRLIAGGMAGGLAMVTTLSSQIISQKNKNKIVESTSKEVKNLQIQMNHLIYHLYLKIFLVL